MADIEVKTNWASGDTVYPTDVNRIEKNVEAINNDLPLPDDKGISLSEDKKLILKYKLIETADGDKSVLNVVTGDNIAYDDTTTINQKIDSKAKAEDIVYTAWYGTTDTAMTAADKVITLDNTDGFELKTGTTINILFTAKDVQDLTTAAPNPRLVINGLAAPIVRNDLNYLGIPIFEYLLQAGYHQFQFDGTNWVWLDNPMADEALKAATMERWNQIGIKTGEIVRTTQPGAIGGYVQRNVVIEDLEELYSGLIVGIKINSIVNSTDILSFRVNGKGVVNSVFQNGVGVQYSANIHRWVNGDILLMQYDGTNWNILTPGIFTIVSGRGGGLSTDVAKTATISYYNAVSGTIVALYMLLDNTADNPTLNTLNSGAKPILKKGIPISADNIGWKENSTGYFVYDGSNWNITAELDATESTGYLPIVGDIEGTYGTDLKYSTEMYLGSLSTTGNVANQKYDVIFDNIPDLGFDGVLEVIILPAFGTPNATGGLIKRFNTGFYSRDDHLSISNQESEYINVSTSTATYYGISDLKIKNNRVCFSIGNRATPTNGSSIRVLLKMYSQRIPVADIIPCIKVSSVYTDDTEVYPIPQTEVQKLKQPATTNTAGIQRNATAADLAAGTPNTTVTADNAKTALDSKVDKFIIPRASAGNVRYTKIATITEMGNVAQKLSLLISGGANISSVPMGIDLIEINTYYNSSIPLSPNHFKVYRLTPSSNSTYAKYMYVLNKDADNNIISADIWMQQTTFSSLVEVTVLGNYPNNVVGMIETGIVAPANAVPFGEEFFALKSDLITLEERIAALGG